MRDCRQWWVTIGLIGIVATDLPARGELLYFAAGGAVQLPATIEGDAVRVEAPEGTYTFDRSDFRKIVPGHWPDREWSERAERARAGGVAERYQAARWALDNGLVDPAAAMLRSAHEADASQQPTARMVAAIDRLDAPCPEPDLEAIARALPGRFKIAKGEHVVLFHQHEDDEAKQRVALLEQIATAFYLEFAGLGIELPAPSQKLVSAWFATRADYLAFLRAEGAEAFLTTRGYHHPTRHLVVAYDSRSDDEQRRVRDGLEARRRELDGFERQLERLPRGARFRLAIRGEPARTLDRAGARATLGRLRREVDRQQLLIEQSRYRLDRCIAAHEMVHQLVASSRLAPRQEAFPIWLHEGLAMQFEAFRGGQWAGLGTPPTIRLNDWRALHPPPRLVPLLRDAGLERGYRRDPYAQAWGFVAYLLRSRPADFVALLDRLRLPSSGLGDRSGRVLDAVHEVLGNDLEPVQADWYRTIAERRTPLEDEDDPERSGPP